jgi:Pyruvate/2-oxoacid:ferredoxin oxidoreductase gamma subunit/ferredoxin
MTGRAERLRGILATGGTVDLRGTGKAGGGLVLAVQAFGGAISDVPGLEVQDWPLFSSARKGANVTAFLRIGRGFVEIASAVTEPAIAVLMNEAAAEEQDFAEGTQDALYVVNTICSPAEAARKYRLSGTVATIAGDDLGNLFLQRPLANVAVLAALVRASGLIEPPQARASLASRLRKRRLPERIVEANLAMFDAALSRARIEKIAGEGSTSHLRAPFRGYGPLPVGAQSRLRTSRTNRTAGYGRPGVRIEFADPSSRCNGCSLCVVQCPEGIIEFRPDPARGTLVTGARFLDFCKACRECVNACPLDLFTETAIVARPDAALVEG